MTFPTIRTKDLSMDTVVALRDTLKIRITLEDSDILMWRWRNENVGKPKKGGGYVTGLSDAGMADLVGKRDALKKEYSRIQRACREAGR